MQTLLLLTSNKYYILWVSVCWLSYPAWNAHAPHWHQWPVRLYNIFPHYLPKVMVFERTSLIIKCVLIFSTNFSEIIFILRITEEDKIKNVYFSSCKVPVIMVRFLMKLEFSRQTFGKYKNIKFHTNPSSGSRVVLCGRTDRQTDKQKTGRQQNNEAVSSFLQFCKSA